LIDSSTISNSIILFDGICNLCSNSVKFIIRHDKKNKFKFGSLQSDSAKKLLEPYHLPLEELNSFVLLENGKIYLRSRAVLRIASRLDGVWKLSAVLYIFPSFISDAVYNLVAKYRYRVFGKRDTCMIPTPELESRFI